MRIISKFSDYYDTALGYGIDKTLIFNRNESFSLSGEDKPRLDHVMMRRQYVNTYNYKDTPVKYGHDGCCSIEVIVIGFCGKIYPLIRADILIEYSPNETDSRLIYGKDIYEINEQCIKETGNAITYYFNVGDRFINASQRTEKELETFHKRFLKNWETLSPENKHLEDVFQKYNIPYFYLSNAKFDSCPVLKEFNFHRHVDPYTAFQEISMYVGGVLTRKETETVEISDKDKRDSKGFDDKSFKHRTKKKK